MEKAACKGMTHIMFPRYFNDKTYDKEAKKICEKCSVKKNCLEYALEFPPQDMAGVWGGLTPAQLMREQSRRKIKPVRPTVAMQIENYRKGKS